MLKNEFYRVFIKQKFLFIVPLLLILKIISLSLESPTFHSEIEMHHDAYVSYISEVSGKLTPETENRITSDYSNMLADREAYTEIRSCYENGSISEDEYRDAISEIEDTLNEASVITLAHEEYLYAIEDPANRYILYSNGWEAFLANERMDLVLILVVILLAAILFGLDHESGAVQMVQTSVFGKSRLFAVRQGVLATAILGICVLFFAVEYLFFSFRYSLPMPFAPLQSLISFRESPFQLSIFGTTLCIWFLRILGCFLLSQCVVLCVSVFRKIWLSVLLCGAFVGIPYGLWNQKTIPYYFQPLGLLIGNGYFKGRADFVDTDGMLVISRPFAGIAPSLFLVLLLLSICAGGTLYLVSLQMHTGGLFRNICRKCIPVALCCAVLASITIFSLHTFLNQQIVEYTTVYSNGMGFSDEDYIYMNDTTLQAMEHDGTDNFALIRDITKQSDEIIAYYVDEDYIYYVQRDLDYGTIYYWRIDKQSFHETCVYKETRGQRNQQKTTRYLGLISDINIENVEYDTYAREDILAFWADGDFLFVLDSNGVNRIDLVHKRSEQIIQCQISSACVAYQYGILYYADLQNRVYSYDIALNKTTLLDISHCQRLYLCGGILFFTTFDHEIGYYDSTSHLIEDVKISDTSQLSCNGWAAYFCNDKMQPVLIDLADFSSTVLKYDKLAYQIKAYVHSPYISLYTMDPQTKEWFWDTRILEK